MAKCSQLRQQEQMMPARVRDLTQTRHAARWASMASRLLAMDAYGAILRGRSKNVPEECC
jgi:hypothetical protein